MTTTTPLRRPEDGVGAAVRTLASWHRPLAGLTVLMGAGVAVCLVGWALDPRLLDGQSVWVKPLKFGVSIGVYAATLAWFTSLVDRPRLRRLARWAGTVGALAGLLEMVLVTAQAARGTHSHFAIGTGLDAAVYALMGVGAVTLYSATLVIGLVLLATAHVPDRSLRWALRLGVAIGVAGLSVGFLMTVPSAAQLADPAAGVMGAHSVGGADGGPGLPFLGWSSEHGDLRVAHFIGMHALQLLPLLALALRRTRLGDGDRVRVVVLVAAGQAALTGLTLWQALRGQPFTGPDALTLGAGAAIGLPLLVAAAALVRRVRSGGAHTG